RGHKKKITIKNDRPSAMIDAQRPRERTKILVHESPPACDLRLYVARTFTNAAPLVLPLLLTYTTCSQRILDFSDEGFYYTSAWLAYSHYGDSPVDNLLLNFAEVLGLPYLIINEPPILELRFLSLLCLFGTSSISCSFLDYKNSCSST